MEKTMLRLRLMPLVPDFGEYLDNPLGVVQPKTRLVFTQDYRIFEQFSHFPGTLEYSQALYLKVEPLPEKLQIIELAEDCEASYTRKDASGSDLMVATAKQLKTLIIPSDTSPSNRAIKAYIDALPDTTPVILGWE